METVGILLGLFIAILTIIKLSLEISKLVKKNSNQ